MEYLYLNLLEYSYLNLALYKVEQGDVVAFYGGLQVVHTNYASDYKIRLNDDTDIDIPQVRISGKCPVFDNFDSGWGLLLRKLLCYNASQMVQCNFGQL